MTNEKVEPTIPESSTATALAALSAQPGTTNCSIDQRYITSRELRQRFPVCDMTIWRWIRDPKIGFPAPVKFGLRNHWWLPIIIKWEQDRVARSPPIYSGRPE
jgi:predicted DNA-binding transcriptional regulator AlpA